MLIDCNICKLKITNFTIQPLTTAIFSHMQIRRLTKQDTPTLLKTFNDAFADYVVPFKLNAEQLDFKITQENIELEWSIGVFEEEKLVAFIMHGVREINGKKTFYNAGTGIIPQHRGQGLIGKMYDYILPYLKEYKADKILLEVIENNLPAIRSYEKNGFVVNRKLLCFGGEIKTKTTINTAVIKELENISWDIFQSFWDVLPSWQNDKPSMEITEPETLGAFVKDELVGYILFNNKGKKIHQVAVAPNFRRKSIGSQLIEEVGKIFLKEEVRINNIDERAQNLNLFFKKQGLVNRINQYEMIKVL